MADNDSTIRPSSSRLAYHNYSSTLTTMYSAAGKTKLEFEVVSNEGEKENKQAIPKIIKLKGLVLGSLKTIGATYLKPAYYSPTPFEESIAAIGQAIIEINTFLSAHAENYKYDSLNGSEDAFDVLTCCQHWQENRMLVQEDKAIYHAFVQKHALELGTPIPSGRCLPPPPAPNQGQAEAQKQEGTETPSTILNRMLSSSSAPISTPQPTASSRSLTRPRT